MVRRILALFALGLSAALQASLPAGPIEKLVESGMASSGVPGLAYAVVADGEIEQVGARGVAEIGRDREVTPDTPFLAGSISKSFTALAVMQLVEAGKIGLDDEISRHLDVFGGKPAGAITVRQLLSHTSGYSTYQGNQALIDDKTGPDALARRAAMIAEIAPATDPGTGWAYSNANYIVAGRLIEVISGQDFNAYIQSAILEPAGMAHSFVAEGTGDERTATGHRPWFGTKRPMHEDWTHRAMAPAGGIVASASDLARYMQVMLNGEDDILSAAGKAEMLRPASEASPYYGLGWYLYPENGIAWHGGTSPGAETLAMMLPAQRKGVVVLTNAGSGTGFGEVGPLLDSVAAHALDLENEEPGSRWPQKAIFLSLLLLPALYLLSMVWAWRHRAALRAKSGPFGLFSLWFPLLTTVAAAWAVLHLVPGLIGAPIGTLSLFQPDLGLAMYATAGAGVLWAVFRLAVAYGGKPRRA